jgi:hypothetical protein
MFQKNPVLRIAIMRCKINGFRVLSAAAFSWLLLRLDVETLPAGRLFPIPKLVTVHEPKTAKNQRNNVESGLYKT